MIDFSTSNLEANCKLYLKKHTFILNNFSVRQLALCIPIDYREVDTDNTK